MKLKVKPKSFKIRLKKFNFLKFFNYFFKLAVLAAFIFFVYFFLFTDYYYIREIRMLGLNTVSKEDVHKVIDQYINEKYFSTIPQKQIFLFPDKKLEEDLYQKFVFANIKILKKMPDILEIRLSERIGTIIWISEKKYYLIDDQGIVIKTLTKPKSNLELPIFNIEPNLSQKPGDPELEINPEETELNEQSEIEVSEEELDQDVKEIIERINKENLTKYPFFSDISNKGVNLGVNVIEESQIAQIKQVIDSLKQTNFIIDQIKLNLVSNQIIFKNQNFNLITDINQDPKSIKKHLETAINKDFIINQYLDVRLAPKLFYK